MQCKSRSILCCEDVSSSWKNIYFVLSTFFKILRQNTNIIGKKKIIVKLKIIISINLFKNSEGNENNCRNTFYFHENTYRSLQTIRYHHTHMLQTKYCFKFRINTLWDNIKLQY